MNIRRMDGVGTRAVVVSPRQWPRVNEKIGYSNEKMPC